mmetsp:Transcript_7839/g.18478  ORF Transcript_7839/g.18478 Transcript_7839/m.18478 type:complete len:419 (-) Transcript_7839:517-1773(-)
MRKSLLKPLCSKSWMHPAISPARSSSRPTNLPSPPLLSKQCMDCTTSATCVALWYGLSECPTSIARRKLTSFTWSRLNSSMRLCLRKTCHDSTCRGSPSASFSSSNTLKVQSLAFSRHCRNPLSCIVLVLRLVDSVDTELSSDLGLPDSERSSGKGPPSEVCALKLSPKSSPSSTISDPATSRSLCCISSFVVCWLICIRPSSPSTLRKFVTSWCEIIIIGSPVTGSFSRCANTRQYHRESWPSSPRRRISKSTSNVDPSSVSASIMLSYAVRRSVRSNPNEPEGWRLVALSPRRSRSPIPKMSLCSQIVFPNTCRAAGLQVMRWPSKVKKQRGYGEHSSSVVMYFVLASSLLLISSGHCWIITAFTSSPFPGRSDSSPSFLGINTTALHTVSTEICLSTPSATRERSSTVSPRTSNA